MDGSGTNVNEAVGHAPSDPPLEFRNKLSGKRRTLTIFLRGPATPASQRRAPHRLFPQLLAERP